MSEPTSMLQRFSSTCWVATPAVRWRISGGCLRTWLQPLLQQTATAWPQGACIRRPQKCRASLEHRTSYHGILL